MDYNIITAIDIGTTKIATIVVKYSKPGNIEILGHSVVPCKGLSKGNVVDVEKTAEGTLAFKERGMFYFLLI